MLEQGEVNLHIVGDRRGEPLSVLIADVVWLALERESRERVRHWWTSFWLAAIRWDKKGRRGTF